MPAQVIFGDIKDLDPAAVGPALIEAGIDRIDTAARYMNGESERKLGRSNLAKSFVIDTKILITFPAEGTLTPEAIEKSLSNSLQALQVDEVNVLYCHGPDFQTSLAEQAKAFDEQYRKGRFAKVGPLNRASIGSRELIDSSLVSRTFQRGCLRSGCESPRTTTMLCLLSTKDSTIFSAVATRAHSFRC